MGNLIKRNDIGHPTFSNPMFPGQIRREKTMELNTNHRGADNQFLDKPIFADSK
jgi:hypothetical protein